MSGCVGGVGVLEVWVCWRCGCVGGVAVLEVWLSVFFLDCGEGGEGGRESG